jgi:hypothetical protein
MNSNSLQALFLAGLLGMMVTSILCIAFGETTIKKLKKNDQLKSELDHKLIGYPNIIGVAQALSLPRWATYQFVKFFSMSPDPNVLYMHTTKLDRVLGRVFYWTLATSVSCEIACIFL